MSIEGFFKNREFFVMRFRSAASALEWFCRHQTTSKTNHHKIITALDIEKILATFPLNIQKSLIDFTLGGNVTQFTKRALNVMTDRLDQAGYLKQSTSSGNSQAVSL